MSPRLKKIIKTFLLIVFIIIPAILFWVTVYMNRNIVTNPFFNLNEVNDILKPYVSEADIDGYKGFLSPLFTQDEIISKEKAIDLLKRQVKNLDKIDNNLIESASVDIVVFDKVDTGYQEFALNFGDCKASFVKHLGKVGFVTIRHCLEKYRILRMNDDDSIGFRFLKTGDIIKIPVGELKQNIFTTKGKEFVPYIYLGKDSFEDFPIFVEVKDTENITKLEKYKGLSIDNEKRENGTYYFFPEYTNDINSTSMQVFQKVHELFPMKIEVFFDKHFDEFTQAYKNEKLFSKQYLGIVPENRTHICAGPGSSGSPIFNENGDLLGVFASTENDGIDPLTPRLCGDVGISVFE